MKKQINPDTLLLGAHTSAAGGVQNALKEGKEIGATTIQLFTSNQRQWKARQLTDETIELWKETLKETGLKEIMSHDSYLINLGSPDPEGLEKSRAAFLQEVERCKALEISYLNFHPGASLNGTVQDCLDRIADGLLHLEPLLHEGNLQMILETTAGQGSAVGYKFEQIGYIIDKVKSKIPVGVCIDTCHIFVAGYDIRTPQGWDNTLKEFDRHIGLPLLKAFHLNDSVKDLGSRVDRHKELGEGKIGWDSFHFLMRDPRTQQLPKYLETPGGPELWVKEIKKLRELASTPLSGELLHAHKN